MTVSLFVLFDVPNSHHYKFLRLFCSCENYLKPCPTFLFFSDLVYLSDCPYRSVYLFVCLSLYLYVYLSIFIFLSFLSLFFFSRPLSCFILLFLYIFLSIYGSFLKVFSNCFFSFALIISLSVSDSKLLFFYFEHHFLFHFFPFHFY